jgi:uncharacterized protein YkwD
MRPFRPLLAAALCVAAAAPAQTEPVDEASSVLLSRLRARDLSVADAAAIAGELAGRDTRTRLSASDTLRTIYAQRDKSHQRARDKLLTRIAELAAAVQKQALQKKGAARVDLLRDEVLALSRGEDLSKERIHADIDPRIAELRELLLPSADDVLAADARAGDALAELRAERNELESWFALYADMLAGLEANRDVERHLSRRPPPTLPEPATALDDAIALARFTGLPMSGSDRRALADNTAQKGHMDPEELAGTAALNELRYALGLPLLFIDEKLGSAARDHSHDMHELGFFSHTSPVDGKRTFGARASRFGTSASAENIAAGATTGADAIRQWYYSPGHHRNMLGGHRRTGLGRSAELWTQLFGG